MALLEVTHSLCTYHCQAEEEKGTETIELSLNDLKEDSKPVLLRSLYLSLSLPFPSLSLFPLLQFFRRTRVHHRNVIKSQVDQLWIFVPGNHGEEEETVRKRISPRSET
jgi:hypothetical protein